MPSHVPLCKCDFATPSIYFPSSCTWAGPVTYWKCGRSDSDIIQLRRAMKVLASSFFTFLEPLPTMKRSSGWPAGEVPWTERPWRMLSLRAKRSQHLSHPSWGVRRVCEWVTPPWIFQTKLQPPEASPAQTTGEHILAVPADPSSANPQNHELTKCLFFFKPWRFGVFFFT